MKAPREARPMQPCGCNTVKLKEEYRAFQGTLKRLTSSLAYADWKTAIHRWLTEHGIPHGRVTSDWWDADHIRPVVEGGGECGLENYRTLCISCHRIETVALAQKRARERRLARQPELPGVAQC